MSVQYKVVGNSTEHNFELGTVVSRLSDDETRVQQLRTLVGLIGGDEELAKMDRDFAAGGGIFEDEDGIIQGLRVQDVEQIN